jgi:hypothetical protein
VIALTLLDMGIAVACNTGIDGWVLSVESTSRRCINTSNATSILQPDLNSFMKFALDFKC